MDKPKTNIKYRSEVAYCPSCEEYCKEIVGLRSVYGAETIKEWNGKDYIVVSEPGLDCYCNECETPVLWEPSDKEIAQARKDLEDADKKKV